MPSTYPAGTNVREVRGWNRSIKALFECKEHPGIHYRSKQPSWSQWFPGNQEADDIAFGIKQDPCPHTFKDDVWVLVKEYTSEDSSGL